MKLAAFIKLYPSTYVTLEEYTPNLQKIYTYLGKTSAEKNVYFGPLFFGRQKRRFARITENISTMIMMVAMIIMMRIMVILMMIMKKITKTSQELRMLSSVTINCQVLNCQNCNQLLKSHKSPGLSFQLSKWQKQLSELWKLSSIVKNCKKN